MVTSIAVFVEWLRLRGNLHDAGVTSFYWVIEDQRLEIAIDDANWNSEGMPDYAGHEPVIIVLNGIKSMTVEVDNREKLNIYRLEVHNSEHPELQIEFWPAGNIACHFASVDILDAKYRKL